MKNLHKVFCSNFTQFHVSYSTFCKLRPFWIVQRKVFQRDTCLCMLHENMKFMVSRLKHLRIISESTSKEVLESLCCSDSLDINKCLERRCSDCKGKEIKFLDFSKEDTVSLNKWVLKKESYVIKGKTKTSQKYTRDIIKCSIEELVEELKHQMPKFMSHVSNIIHQQGVIKHKKDELKPNEAIIHIDFSENYECKYYEEIQAFHFGGSREQVSIHTVMLYYKNEVTGPTLTKAFCTLSNSLNHDANAVCAHLRPVLEKVLHVLPHLRTIYFVSDGPNNQYRNRKMFYLIATYLPSILPSIEVISWNYTEAGHGKGAPDGLGGTLKRTADTLVAQGKDIQSFDHLIAELQNSVEKIDIISIPRSEIQSFGETVEDKSVTFKGTMKVHQVIWRRTDPKSLNFRRLSCFKCPPHECCHYGMGTQKLSNEPSTPGTKPSSSKTRTYSCDYTDSEEGDVESPEQNPSKLYNEEESLLNLYVVAKFKGKKTTHYYVGKIVEENNEDEQMSYCGQFMRKNLDNSFSYPSRKDQCLVDLEDIIQVSKEPVLTRRHIYLFKDLDVTLFSI